jgi:hypothetical protein
MNCELRGQMRHHLRAYQPFGRAIQGRRGDSPEVPNGAVCHCGAAIGMAALCYPPGTRPLTLTPNYCAYPFPQDNECKELSKYRILNILYLIGTVLLCYRSASALLVLITWLLGRLLEQLNYKRRPYRRKNTCGKGSALLLLRKLIVRQNMVY